MPQVAAAMGDEGAAAMLASGERPPTHGLMDESDVLLTPRLVDEEGQVR